MKNMQEIYYGLLDELKHKNLSLVADLIKAKAVGSYETLIAVAESALRGELTIDNFNEKCAGLMPRAAVVEESTKPETKVEDIEESKRDFATLFGVEPRAKATTKESKPPIKKNNGSSDNFIEGNPFNGDRKAITETNTPKNICGKGDKVMCDSWLKEGSITQAQYISLTTGKPEGYEKLTEQQKKDFDFARAIGLNEQDSFTLVKITGTNLKEVSHRR